MNLADGQSEAGELGSQTDVERFLATGGDDPALKKMFGDKLRKALIPFQKLCNPEAKEAETERIHGVKWKVYRLEQGFDDLFWAYWWSTGEKWKRKDQEIGTFQSLDTQGNLRTENFYSESEREELAKVAHDTDAWKKYGQQLLESWKKDGVPPGDFLKLACFRGCCNFKGQVKLITGQNRLDRALPWFRRFLKSRFTDEDMAERAMAKYREKGFPLEQLDFFKDTFAKWRTGEVTLKRREACGKRGRVKSKSDERLGARYKGKRISPSK